MRHVHFNAVILIAALWMGAIQARATTISLNSNVVVSDTYEGDTVGSAAVADVGAWSNDGPFYFSRNKGVVATGSPGAFEGTQYASLGGAVNQQLSANMTLALGNVIKWDSMVYIPTSASAVSSPWQFVVFGGPNAGLANRLLSFQRLSSGMWSTDGVAGTYAGPSSYAADTWQHWVLDYTVGAASATLTIDGVSAPIVASHTNLVSSNGFLSFFTNTTASTGPVYLDAVPEPSSLVIMMLGGVAFAAIARRKRV